MFFFKQLSLITTFYIVGEIFSFLITQVFPNILIPGSLLGMILLFLLLILKIIKYEWIELVGTFFINNMGFFFVPSVISLLAYFDIIKPVLGKLILILFASFCITFIFVGYSAKLALSSIQQRTRKKDD